jgi:hypothetical protein
MNYFSNITTLESLKKEFKSLVMIHHPDKGGETSVMQDIIAQFAEMSKRVRGFGAGKGDDGVSYDAKFVDIINNLAHLDGIIIEIVGSWVWISGDTKPVKDTIKENGFKYASRKKMWFYSENGPSKSRGKNTIETIRATYGSIAVKGTARKAISA